MSETERKEVEIWRQVSGWRRRAENKLAGMPAGKDRETLAAKFYEADRIATKSTKRADTWPEIERYLGDGEKELRKAKTERLLRIKSVCGNLQIYELAWLPTLQELRERYPFDPEDDLTKPYQNKNLRMEKNVEK